MYNADIISMPDKWEYPWYAAWDLAFHVLALRLVDEDFSKQQLDLMLRDHYLHPNGQLPANEWNFSDVNPPVHAWSTRSEEHTSELQSRLHLVCRLLLEKKTTLQQSIDEPVCSCLIQSRCARNLHPHALRLEDVYILALA